MYRVDTYNKCVCTIFVTNDWIRFNPILLNIGLNHPILCPSQVHTLLPTSNTVSQ